MDPVNFENTNSLFLVFQETCLMGDREQDKNLVSEILGQIKKSSLAKLSCRLQIPIIRKLLLKTQQLRA